MDKLLDVEYYRENPLYSECPCIMCKGKTMRLKGIQTFEDYNREDKSLFQCEKCGQQAYIDIEWMFTITL